MSEQLRFAGLVRVSTEGQRDEGASLETQKDSIKGSVEQLGGNPSSIKWYEGAEHSTEGYERKICDKLLVDAKKGLFDAVICYDLSRWSRDNLRSKTNLKVLEKNGIEFYQGTKKFDLSNYDDAFIIGLMTEINERAAKEIKAKMGAGKITLAQQGWAINSGSLPWGRTFDNDKKATFNKVTKKVYTTPYDRWGLKGGAKEQMNEIVDRFINGEKTAVLSKELKMHPCTLLVLFKNNLGNKWIRKFYCNKVRKKIPIPIDMPALIDDEKKIKKVQEVIASKRTWAHGSYKHDYLFSSMIFDKNCGHTLTGSTKKTTKGELRYYYHQDNYKKCLCGSRKYVPEKALEVAVLSRLFYMYRDDKKIEEAVLRAYPNQEKQKELRAEDERDNKELLKIEKEEDRIMSSFAEGSKHHKAAHRTLDKLEERKVLFQTKIEKRKPLLEALPPSSKEIKRNTQFMIRTAKRCYDTPSRISEMSFKDKRRLMELAFGGKDIKGNRLGIYIEQGSTKKDIKFSIRGQHSTHPDYKKRIVGKLPMPLDELQEVLGIDARYEGDYNPFDEKEIEKAELRKKKRAKSQGKRQKVKSVYRRRQ